MSFEFKLPKKSSSWLEDVHTHDDVIHIHFADNHEDLITEKTFAVASSKKELKQLKKSDAGIIYNKKNGKLYLNGNGAEKGWGPKDLGGLITKVKGKPNITADNISGFEQHIDNDSTLPNGSCCEDDHSGHDHSGHDHSGHDHSGHDHASHRIV